MYMNYKRITKNTLRVLKRRGIAVVITREENNYSTFSPVTGASNNPPSTINGYAVFVDYKEDEIDGTNICTTDRKMLFSGPALKKGDLFGDEKIVFIKKNHS